MITFWIISYVPVWVRPTDGLPDRDPLGYPRPGVPNRDQWEPDRGEKDPSQAPNTKTKTSIVF